MLGTNVWLKMPHRNDPDINPGKFESFVERILIHLSDIRDDKGRHIIVLHPACGVVEFTNAVYKATKEVSGIDNPH